MPVRLQLPNRVPNRTWFDTVAHCLFDMVGAPWSNDENLRWKVSPVVQRVNRRDIKLLRLIALSVISSEHCVYVGNVLNTFVQRTSWRISVFNCFTGADSLCVMSLHDILLPEVPFFSLSFYLWEKIREVAVKILFALCVSESQVSYWRERSSLGRHIKQTKGKKNEMKMLPT